MSNPEGRIALTTAETLANNRANPARHWFVGDDSPRARFDKAERMTIFHWPKFKLDPTWPVFTIGSCFARNVEAALIRQGVPLVTDGYGVPPERYEIWDEKTQSGGGMKLGVVDRGAFNKYTTHSMRVEVERAIGGLKLHNEGLMEIAQDRWFDPHSAGLRLTDFETALDTRHRIADATAQVTKAKITFITLGLTETWIDATNDVPMNHPPYNHVPRRKELFRFIDFEYEEVLEQARTVIALIRKAVPDMLFVVTVSPVPHSTFKLQDSLVSCSGAKSVLRAVAERLYRTYDYVDYFPSYEIVMNTPRPIAWHADQCHVLPDLVDHVMRQFMTLYYPERNIAAA